MRSLWIILFLSVLASANGKIDSQTKQAIVKIYTTAQVPNYQMPWMSSVQNSTGSGSIIEGGYILTNAHVVENQTFMEVQRYGQRKRYIAKLYKVSHQADLALLRVEDPSFLEGVVPLKFGGLPQVEQKIVVYGYPMGGSTLSATIGVVSRVEHHSYVHSGEMFLSIQIDAAVNPGNSGGPALSGGKIVGVVMQGIARSQNIGYLVPVSIVKHFIEDIEDGTYDGFADLGVYTQKLENPALRRYCKIDHNITGKLVDKVAYRSTLNGVIKAGDILTSVDGYNIENDGTVAFRKDEYTDLHYAVDAYQMGDKVPLGVWRDGKHVDLNATLKYTSNDLYLVKTTRYDVLPSYFIYGGYVFAPLTRNLLASLGGRNVALSSFASQTQTKEKTEVVLVLRVLASDMTRGNTNFGMWAIEKLNGETFKDFKEFVQKLQSIKEPYIMLEDGDAFKIIIDTAEAQKKQKALLRKYSIEYDRSVDLREE